MADVVFIKSPKTEKEIQEFVEQLESLSYDKIPIVYPDNNDLHVCREEAMHEELHKQQQQLKHAQGLSYIKDRDCLFCKEEQS